MLEERLIEWFFTEARRPREDVSMHGGRPHKIGGQWFCPGCGVMDEESTPGHLCWRNAPRASRSSSTRSSSGIHISTEKMDGNSPAQAHTNRNPICVSAGKDIGQNRQSKNPVVSFWRVSEKKPMVFTIGSVSGSTLIWKLGLFDYVFHAVTLAFDGNGFCVV
jgi:hypothetical protein